MPSKAPPGYKATKKLIHSTAAYIGCPFSDYINHINAVLKTIEDEGGIKPVIDYEVGWDYDEDETYAYYFIPMTETEIQQQKTRTEKARKAAAAKKEKKLAKEREEYERLRAKFENNSELLY